MNTLREAVQEYLALRRSLGFKLREDGARLADFAAFMEQRKASYITHINWRSPGPRSRRRRLPSGRGGWDLSAYSHVTGAQATLGRKSRPTASFRVRPDV